MDLDSILPGVGAVCAALGAWCYKMFAAANKAKEKERSQNIQHDTVLVDAIREVSVVLGKLYSFLETTANNCAACRHDHTESMTRLMAMMMSLDGKIDKLYVENKLTQDKVNTLNISIEKRRGYSDAEKIEQLERSLTMDINGIRRVSDDL